MTTIIKKNFLLTNKINNHKKIFNIIINQIPRSIFTILDVGFFKNLIKAKIIEVFVIKKENRITSVINVITNNNYNILKKKNIFLLFIETT